MMDIPKSIVVQRHGRDVSVTIDGERFPYPFARDGVSADIRSDELPAVTITLVAERVDVVNNVDG